MIAKNNFVIQIIYFPARKFEQYNIQITIIINCSMVYEHSENHSGHRLGMDQMHNGKLNAHNTP